MSTRRRKLVGAFIALFLFVQIGVPTVGLYASHLFGYTVEFSWHMFSRVPAEADG